MVNPASAASVLLAPASGPDVGGGHILRCLSLAHSLRQAGADCAFFVEPYGAEIIKRFSKGAYAVLLDADSALNWCTRTPYVVVDDYLRSAELEARLRPLSRRLLAIDDLADRRHDADLLLDPGYGRTAEDYEGLLPEASVLLLGPRYALLRPDFVQRRAATLSRPTPVSPSRIFISFGLSDVHGIAARATGLVLGYDCHAHIDLAMASDAQSVPAARHLAQSQRRLTLHLDAMNVAELMGQCDLAIGAGGSSTWERMCLGRASLAVAVADNQRPLLRALETAGVLVAADLDEPAFDLAFTSALSTLWDQETRRALEARSAPLCDGKGAQRVTAALLGS